MVDGPGCVLKGGKGIVARHDMMCFQFLLSGQSIKILFFKVWGCIFRFSGAFCVDCALFRPKRPPGARFWAKADFFLKKT